jgi:FtsH-binding integral membrane protein
MTIAALAGIAGAALNLFPAALAVIALPSLEAGFGLIQNDPTWNDNDHSMAILLVVPWFVVAVATVVAVLVILRRAKLSKPWIGIVVAVFVLLVPVAVIMAVLHFTLHDFFPWLFS